jgi:hypothetical protein
MGTRARGILATGLLTAAGVCAFATNATAAVTIGQTGPVSGLCAQNQDWAQQVVSSGNPYVVPSIPPAISLSLTSWSHEAHSTPNQKIKFRVYRPVMGLTYRVVAQDIHSLNSGVLNTFPANIRVEPGDILGISNGPDTPSMGCGTGAFTETDLTNGTSNTPPGLAVGDTVTFTSGGGARLDVSAVVEPTNAFTIGQTTRNKKKGTATVALQVPNPGSVTLVSNGSTSNQIVSPGEVKLAIKAIGKKRKKLNRKGKASLPISISYVPAGGAVSSQATTVKLKKRLPKKR